MQQSDDLVSLFSALFFTINAIGLVLRKVHYDNAVFLGEIDGSCSFFFLAHKYYLTFLCFLLLIV